MLNYNAQTKRFDSDSNLLHKVVMQVTIISENLDEPYGASIPGRTEDGPGIDCLRMRHINPQKLRTPDNIVLCSVKQ